ncbi:fungal_trans-domain-containing protein [Aspergillus niger]|uniref:Fungal_trans-domain-containing protein n=1 Tax=Aspergillus niger TaxID=5061 RepID=A0A100IJC2_ASPNG|nr:fungal_trans-domain-containing protein [Aspergillus niger]
MVEADSERAQEAQATPARPTSDITFHSIASETRSAKRRKTQLACNACRDQKTRLNGRLNSPPPPLENYSEAQVLMQQDSRPSFQNEMIGTDATVIVPSLEDNEHCSSANTSTMALVQSTMRATNSSKTTGNMPGLNIASNIDQFASPQHIRRSRQNFEGPEINAFTLPTRRMADNFMSCFWNFTHPIFPILHKPTFVISYDSLWVPPTESFSGSVCGKAEDPIFLSTMNIVFAIGCQFSDLVAPGKRTSLADQFYQRSRALYDIDALDSASLLTVQMLLLTGLYLQSTKYASRCWHMVGLAIRTAQDIGIHIEHTRPSKTQLEREMRRRVWHNCVILDRLLALTFGRPNIISSNSAVPPPLIIDDEYLLQDGEGIQRSQSQSSMEFFVCSIQLFEILNGIMSRKYRCESINHSNGGAEELWWSRGCLEDVLKLNSALDDWRDTIPNNLRLESAVEARADPRSDTAVLQAKVLYSRFLYIRILLLRPTLLSAAQNRHHLSKGADLGQLRLEEHLAMKMRYIEVLVGVQYIVNTFLCGIVLLAAQLCPIPSDEFDSATLQELVSCCITILEQHKLQIQSAAHAIKILENLQHRVVLACEADIDGLTSNLSKSVDPVNMNTLPGDDYTFNTTSQGDLLQFDEIDTTRLSEAWFMEQVGDIEWLGTS